VAHGALLHTSNGGLRKYWEALLFGLFLAFVRSFAACKSTATEAGVQPTGDPRCAAHPQRRRYAASAGTVNSTQPGSPTAVNTRFSVVRSIDGRRGSSWHGGPGGPLLQCSCNRLGVGCNQLTHISRRFSNQQQ